MYDFERSRVSSGASVPFSFMCYRCLQDMPLEDICNIRSVLPDGSACHSTAGTPWIDLYEGPTTLVYGHDAVAGIQRRPFSIGLDSGCCYGGALTALLWPDNELVSVPAKRVYSAPTKPIPGAPVVLPSTAK